MAWTAGTLVLLALFTRIALGFQVDSDGANNALQAWDLLHGNVFLHGWIIGDATYYTFDLPIFALTEAFLGLSTVTLHVAPAVTFLIVAVCTMAAARTGSRGSARVVRSLASIAVLGAGLAGASGAGVQLWKPDHNGTAAILLICFLLVDRCIERRFTAPVLFAILCAGEVGDALVRYVAVPAIVLVCAYRVVAARRLRSADTAVALAAILSVPTTTLIKAAIARRGGYTMVEPRTAVAPPGQWAHHAALGLRNVGLLFNFQVPTVAPLWALGFAIGAAALLAAAFGFAKVAATWPKASRAEQLICAAIVINFGAYVASTLPTPTNPREFAPLLPFGAVLAAKALVPASLSDPRRSGLALVAAAACAVLPLAAAATLLPVSNPSESPLATFLQRHGLRYGVAWYWNASVVTVVSDGQAQVRAVQPWRGHLAVFNWETNTLWYEPTHYDATFAIAGRGPFASATIPPALFEKYLGKPEMVYNVDGWKVLIYGRNLLREVVPGPRPT